MRRHHQNLRTFAVDGRLAGGSIDSARARPRRPHVLPDQIESRQLRHDVVDEEHVEVSLGEQPLCLARRPRFGDGVARVPQRPSERFENLFFVVDEENRPALCHATACGSRGSSIRSSVPWPGALETAIDPPSPSMMFLAMGKPSPVPPRLVVKYGSKTCGSASGSIPPP